MQRTSHERKQSIASKLLPWRSWNRTISNAA